nr:MAG TPA: replisome organizer protein [Bacteriophage sp.]
MKNLWICFMERVVRMAENKRYYWLKLMDDFFDSKRIKKLRKMAGGDTYTIIYLKMQLLSLKKGGYLEYSGLEDEFYKEIALDIDEDEINVQVTIRYLLSCGLIQTADNIEYLMPFVQDNLGSETASTRRSRKSRENAQKSLQCNSGATVCNNLQQKCNVEIEKDIEIDTDIEKENTKESSPVERFADFVAAYPKACTGYLVETEYCNAVAAGVPEEDLITAARNYAVACRKKKTPVRYIKNPENFLKENLFMAYVKGADDGSTDEKNDKRDAGTHEKSLNELLAERGISGEFEGF